MIPRALISELRERCDKTGILLPFPELKKGDKVKIIIGPFTDYVATVETLEDNQRIWVLIDLMGQKSKMQITPNELDVIH
jgi:transcriptional antiterminator RfaH